MKNFFKGILFIDVLVYIATTFLILPHIQRWIGQGNINYVLLWLTVFILIIFLFKLIKLIYDFLNLRKIVDSNLFKYFCGGFIIASVIQNRFNLDFFKTELYKENNVFFTLLLYISCMAIFAFFYKFYFEKK